MTMDHYLVVHQESQWTISFHGTEQGPFSTKEEAVAAAIAGAQKATQDGMEVEVLVQDVESNFHRAWPEVPSNEPTTPELSTST